MPNNALNNIMVGKANRSRIINLLYKKGELTKQDISQALGLSLPTITQNLRKLMEEGLVEENGTIESTGGRKPKVVALRDNARVAVGVELSKNHVKLVLIDLHARLLSSLKIFLPFENTNSYWEEITRHVESLIASAGFRKEQVLGVGLATPGIVKPEEKMLEFAPTLNIKNVDLSIFTEKLSYPVMVENEANVAGFAEMWGIERLSSAVYVSITKGVGGAVLIDNKVYSGLHFRAGEFGHMTLVPNGLPCSCGSKGCFEAYCSIQQLVDNIKQLDDFFAAVELGRPKERERWDNYLSYLALGLNNLRMIFDTDIIIGGDLAQYLEAYLPELKHKMAAFSSLDKSDASVRICKFHAFSSAVGAAILFIHQFLQ